jgi:hypothetical protein
VSGANLTQAELYIGKASQELISVDPNQVIFTISNVTDYIFGNDSMLYFEEGIPENHPLAQANFEVTPKLVSISPN